MRGAAPLESVWEDPAWKDADVRYALDDRAGASSPPLRPAGKAVDIAFAVGPEGGWSDAERAALEVHGARPLRLGGRVLRAETAVIVGLTVLQYAFGDLASGL
jgi:16S rRNA (uracil1498-N3)-methyltransferase